MRCWFTGKEIDTESSDIVFLARSSRRLEDSRSHGYGYSHPCALWSPISLPCHMADDDWQTNLLLQRTEQETMADLVSAIRSGTALCDGQYPVGMMHLHPDVWSSIPVDPKRVETDRNITRLIKGASEVVDQAKSLSEILANVDPVVGEGLHESTHNVMNTQVWGLATLEDATRAPYGPQYGLLAQLRVAVALEGGEVDSLCKMQGLALLAKSQGVLWMPNFRRY